MWPGGRLISRCFAIRTDPYTVLEAILGPEWSGRYHSFEAGRCSGEEMASIRGAASAITALRRAPGGLIIDVTHQSFEAYGYVLPVSSQPCAGTFSGSVAHVLP